MVTTTDLRRFAFQQGPGRELLGLRDPIADDAPTTSSVPPAACRGGSGRLLPLGTHRLLDEVPYPAGRVGGGVEDVLGHLLLAAFGLQRREPSNRYNDHRVTASVRSKFPVHCFVLDEHGLAYLDLHRHALVEVGLPAPADRPEPGRTTVVLAGRYSDYPAGYGSLRGSLADLELGINLRSLVMAAELFGVPAAVDLDGARCRGVAGLLAGTGPGEWTPPLLVSLDTSRRRHGEPLPAVAATPDADDLLAAETGLHEAVRVAATRYELRAAPAAPAAGLPAGGRPAGPSWARVLWNRSAGRAPAGLYGFSVVPERYGREVLDDHVAAALVPPPHPLLAAVYERVRLSVALQRIDGTPAGLYRLGPGGLSLLRADDGVMRAVENAFGHSLAPDTDTSVRHAGLVWLMSADLAALAAEFGPASWTLLQLTCGWISHGLSIAAAAHDQFARPVRSIDEARTVTCFGLRWDELPTFTVICGRSRFAEPMLDLRT
ncbi:MAG TPA: hypothetical protein VMB79_17450 [Jatrophihabitans sp.]|nr:hypothetical protein [Jatrophihabitans sp.]